MSETTNWMILAELSHGLLNSLKLAVVVLLIGAFGGFALGIAAAYGGRIVRLIVATLLYLTRGLPLIIQVFAIFYLLPLVGPTFDQFTTAIVALGLFASVTISEIVRGGLISISRGQIEAAQALGLSMFATIYLIVLPQAMRVLLAPLVGQFVFLIKATSIISLLGVPELMLAAREIIERDLQGFKVMAFVWFLYTAVCMPLSMLGRYFEKRMSVAYRR